MDRDEFINFARQSNQLTETDQKLINGLRFILNHFKEVKYEIEKPENVEENLIVTAGPSGLDPDYSNVKVSFNTINNLSFDRENKSIKVTFVSQNKTKFADAYKHVLIDRYLIKDGTLYSEKDNQEVTESLLETYFAYLSAKPS